MSWLQDFPPRLLRRGSLADAGAPQGVGLAAGGELVPQAGTLDGLASG